MGMVDGCERVANRHEAAARFGIGDERGVQLFQGDAAAVKVDGLGDRPPNARADLAADGVALECVVLGDRVIVARNCMTITLDSPNAPLRSR
jgi:hypothetical protein